MFQIWHNLFSLPVFPCIFPIWPWSLTIPPISSIRFHPKDPPGTSAKTALWTGLRCFRHNSTCCWWSTVTTVMHLKMSGTAMQKSKSFTKTKWMWEYMDRYGMNSKHYQVMRLPFLNFIAPLCSNGSSKQNKNVTFFLFPVLQRFKTYSIEYPCSSFFAFLKSSLTYHLTPLGQGTDRPLRDVA